jgi:hypothetical protein
LFLWNAGTWGISPHLTPVCSIRLKRQSFQRPCGQHCGVAFFFGKKKSVSCPVISGLLCTICSHFVGRLEDLTGHRSWCHYYRQLVCYKPSPSKTCSQQAQTVMGKADTSTELSSGVSKLTLKPVPRPSQSAKASKKAPEVADSWEDEDVSSGGEEGSNSGQGTSTLGNQNMGTAAPPPTPMSPTYSKNDQSFTPGAFPSTFSLDGQYDGSSAAGPDTRRPEKTDAVARRMIAGALGMKVPRQTEEQRAYDRAVREKERRRRDEEKARDKQNEEDAAKAKQAVWDD